jgi:hypothetical protein
MITRKVGFRLSAFFCELRYPQGGGGGNPIYCSGQDSRHPTACISGGRAQEHGGSIRERNSVCRDKAAGLLWSDLTRLGGTVADKCSSWYNESSEARF